MPVLLTYTEGPVMRHGPNRLLFNSVTAFRGESQDAKYVKSATDYKGIRHISKRETCKVPRLSIHATASQDLQHLQRD